MAGTEGFFISTDDLWQLIGTGEMPQIIDVRRSDVFQAAHGLLPGLSAWQDASKVAEWAAAVDRGRLIVVACKAGHERSQLAAAYLRSSDFDARVLAGGYAAWTEARLPMVAKAALDRFAPRRPSTWVTRRRPKIDRVACPWLIRRFLDPQARVLYVDPPEVSNVAREAGAVPFDIEGVELSHEGPLCSFDTMLRIFGLDGDPALARLAVIVRGADTARPDLAPESAGLHAISLGLSALAGDDDHRMLARGFVIYDALFAWLRFASAERHNWPAKAA